MSQSQILRRICDNPECKKSVDLDLQNPRPQELEEIKNWYSIARETLVGQEMKPIIMQACGKACFLAVRLRVDELFDRHAAAQQAHTASKPAKLATLKDLN